jgi:hypothetical protein
MEEAGFDANRLFCSVTPDSPSTQSVSSLTTRNTSPLPPPKATRGSLAATALRKAKKRRRLFELVERTQDKVLFALHGF